MKTNKSYNRIVDRNSLLQKRVEELEDILCPFNQHKWIEVDYYIESECHAGEIEPYCRRKLQCKCCKKIVFDDDRIGFKYRLDKAD